MVHLGCRRQSPGGNRSFLEYLYQERTFFEITCVSNIKIKNIRYGLFQMLLPLPNLSTFRQPDS